MNTPIAIGFGLIITALLCFDGFLNDWNGLVFLLRKLSDMIEWIAFWR